VILATVPSGKAMTEILGGPEERIYYIVDY
jgi:hypothetical protein